MGFFLDGFLGRRSHLQEWPPQLSHAVVCSLDGDLAMVPLTAPLVRDLTAGAAAWARDASKAGAVVLFSLGEFGDQSHEDLALYSGGSLLNPQLSLRAALAYLRDIERIAFDPGAVDLERYRGENAAEKWAARGALGRGAP